MLLGQNRECGREQDGEHSGGEKTDEKTDQADSPSSIKRLLKHLDYLLRRGESQQARGEGRERSE
jgi:hypothetical protein